MRFPMIQMMFNPTHFLHQVRGDALELLGVVAGGVSRDAVREKVPQALNPKLYTSTSNPEP